MDRIILLVQSDCIYTLAEKIKGQIGILNHESIYDLDLLNKVLHLFEKELEDYRVRVHTNMNSIQESLKKVSKDYVATEVIKLVYTSSPEIIQEHEINHIKNFIHFFYTQNIVRPKTCFHSFGNFFFIFSKAVTNVLETNHKYFSKIDF